MLDVKRLRVLREVSMRGSFSAAAESLAYTQSAVSQQIAALEREAGTVLVERRARGVHLTEAGRALVAHADVILARLADAEAELEAIAGMRGGRLRLVSFPTAGATIAPLAIARFRERHPGVEVTLAPREPDEGLDCLKAGECDIALTVEAGFAADLRPRDRAPSRCSTTRCTSACRPAIASRRSRASAWPTSPRSRWILGTTGRCPDGVVLERACQAAGFEPRVAFQSDDYTAIQGFVAAGVGVCLIPDLALVAVRDDVVIRCLEGRAPVRHVLAATLAGGYVSPAAAAMLEILREVGAEWAAQQGSLAQAS